MLPSKKPEYVILLSCVLIFVVVLALYALFDWVGWAEFQWGRVIWMTAFLIYVSPGVHMAKLFGKWFYIIAVPLLFLSVFAGWLIDGRELSWSMLPAAVIATAIGVLCGHFDYWLTYRRRRTGDKDGSSGQ